VRDINPPIRKADKNFPEWPSVEDPSELTREEKDKTMWNPRKLFTRKKSVFIAVIMI